jgi:single-strand DNA-binding protein
MTDTHMTLIGNVVDTPKLRRTKNGHWVASFRVASTPRRFDREKNAWVDRDTLFVTVTCWRALAENVGASLRKGEPVVVTGRYGQREYEVEEALRTTYELEATAVGHDLTRGVSQFRRERRSALSMPVVVDDDGIPVDDSDHYLEVAEQPASATVDPTTGEVREPGELEVPAGRPELVAAG